MKSIYPGQVFCAQHYDTFTKKFQTHMFVCVYSHGLSEKGNHNVVGLIITSKLNSTQTSIMINKSDNRFLHHSSHVVCDNSFVFDIDNIQVIGQLSSQEFLKILTKRKEVNAAEEYQCIQSLINIKGFETHKK